MMMLSQAAQIVSGQLQGADVLFTDVSKDTRDLKSGDLYVAIKGEHFDGHAFIEQAQQAGAVGALVQDYQDTQLAQVQVGDTVHALGEMAASWRQRSQAKVIGLTGSNGKTTVKEMCRHILSQLTEPQSVLATAGNYNNEIGLPLTLLRLRDQHRYAVIEMGASHVGEIAYLTGLTAPDVALVNNVGPAHLQGFGSLQNTASAKAEIYQGLNDDGIAVINLDDAFAPLWLDATADKTQFTFSYEDAAASVYVDDKDDCLSVHHDGMQAGLQLSVPGKHNVMNALAAITACVALGFALRQVVAALNGFENIAGRLSRKQLNDAVTLLDDSYNANPVSVKAGIDVLVATDDVSILVLGDMGELGADTESLHREVGDYAKRQGVDILLATGDVSRHAVRGFGERGEFFDSMQELIDALKAHLSQPCTVLVKGSRMMHMETVIEALTGSENNNNKTAEQEVN